MRSHSIALIVSVVMAGALACGGDDSAASSAGGGAGSPSGGSGQSGATSGAGQGGAVSGGSGQGGSGGVSAGSAGLSGAAGAPAGGAGGAGAAGGGSGTAGGAAGMTAGAAGQGGSGAGAGGVGGAGQGGGAGATLALAVTPGATSSVVVLGTSPGSVAFQAKATVNGVETDVTASAAWSLTAGQVGSVTAGVVTLAGVGGVTGVVATYQGAKATGSLTVKVTGEAAVGVDAGQSAATFAGATLAAGAPAPALEYPLDGVRLPGNLPAIDAQWAADADSTLFRVRLQSSTVDLTVYTAQKEVTFPDSIWSAFKASTVDAPATVAVDGVGPGGLHVGQAQALAILSDVIPDSAVYVWQNSSATFRVLDIIKGTDELLPSTAPVGGSSGACVGCHRISRDGKRFSYTQTSPYLQTGTLAYNDKTGLFEPRVTPTASGFGTYATFNPSEDTQAPAMLLTRPDYVTQNTAGNVTLAMVDPDTTAPLASNVDGMLGALPAAVGHHALMPDWSPDGSFVTFVAYDGAKNFVRDLGDDVVLGSVVEAPVSWSAATQSFSFGAPKVLVATPDADPDAGQNNLLPTISPDGAYVAFTRAQGWWSIKTQNTTATPLNTTGRIAIVRRSDQKVFELGGGTSGPDKNWSSTWPQWAPSQGQHHAWLAFATERPYGHLLTPQNSTCSLINGQHQCKQLWIMAVDLDKLAGSGEIDPSFPPFRVPGQKLNEQFVSPQWTVPLAKP